MVSLVVVAFGTLMSELSQNTVLPGQIVPPARPGLAVCLLILVVGAFCFLAALRSPGSGIHLFFYAAAVGLTGAALFFLSLRTLSGPVGQTAQLVFDQMFSGNPHPAVLTDGAGWVVSANEAGYAFFGNDPKQLGPLLGELADDGASFAYRHMRTAMQHKSASGAILTNSGRNFLVSATVAEEGRIVWTFHEIDAVQQPTDTVVPVDLPWMRVDAEDRVVALNNSARQLTGGSLPTSPAELTREARAQHGDFVHLTDNAQTRVRVHRVPHGDGLSSVTMLPVSADEIARALPVDFMDVLPVALARIDAKGCLTYMNKAARKLLGTTGAEGQPLSDLVEGLSRSIPERVAEMMRGRSHNPTEVARVQIDGEERFLQVTLKRLELDGAASLLAVMADATEFKALEAQFVQSQKMQAVGQLAGGMAHDFNNLLTAISGHCDLLLLRHSQNDENYSDLMQISQNAVRAAALVSKLLAFSRKQTLMPKIVKLYDTLTDLKHLLNRLLGERVVLRIEHGQDLPMVRIDERQIEQVIMNLVVNARDAMPGGGEVTIRTSPISYLQNTERDGATIPAGDYLRIDVTDTGTGIPDDTIGKIFEPFFTTKGVGKGTGLGLSTAYGIIKQTGGFIFASSKIDLGTTFTLLLPAYVPSEDEKARGLEEDTEDPANQKPRDLSGRGVILLVEDEIPVRSFAARALVTRGYKVLEAGTAEEALDILEDEDLHVDMFVSDVIMPGKDGPTWVQEARERRPDTKVIFVSGYAEDVFDGGKMEIANATFLPKPFSLNQLTHTVKEQIGA